ncbi:hypothetical protein EES42_37835 [Streptomyces sp. ADI95-17]|nr:hypothetical protein EES42_37835 [Streptomyces sp. ADI95-17]
MAAAGSQVPDPAAQGTSRIERPPFRADGSAPEYGSERAVPTASAWRRQSCARSVVAGELDCGGEQDHGQYRDEDRIGEHAEQQAAKDRTGD